MAFPFEQRMQAVLDELHAAAQADTARWAARSGTTSAAQNAAGGGELVRLGEFYLAVSPEQGQFLYLMARAAKARRIVEFGASFGISSLYLAAAARDNGGTLTTTEVHPDKCSALRRTFERAGLSTQVTLLEGDARETLQAIDGPIDLLHLDGWKSGYLPVFRLLRPQMAPGSLVLADNCDHEAAQDYLETVQSPESGCITVVQDGLALSYLLR